MTITVGDSDIRLGTDDWADAFQAPGPGTRTTRRARRSGRSCSPSSRRGTTATSRTTCSTPPCCATGTCGRLSTAPGRCSTRPISSATCGRCPRTCAGARPGSTRRRSGGCSATTPGRGPCRICRCWTPPGSGSVTRRGRGAPSGRPHRGHRTRAHGPGGRRATRGRRLRRREGLLTMLRQPDLREVLVDESALPDVDPDLLAGPFAHIVVDEAQELTDAQWQMLLARCPSRSFTIVGDRAQARHGFTESWQERLQRVGLDRVTLATLSINYRTPKEVMAYAEPVIRAVLPDANVPTSIRDNGLPVVHGSVVDLGSILDTWLAAHADGVACVIGEPAFPPRPRVRSLAPEQTKGLEFDLVVLVDPEAFGTGIEGTVDRYVAMTRATQQLVILTSR
ncbi:hypothetical protein NKG94_05255 [Micromonospora sp. M12]